jgi:serine/threonine-protein kinase
MRKHVKPMWDAGIGGSGSGFISSPGLPSEFATQALNGLRSIVASLGGLSILFIVFTFAGPKLFPHVEIVHYGALLGISIATVVVSTLFAILLYVRAFPPDTSLNLGLIYHIAYCFAVSYIELVGPAHESPLLRGLSFVTVLIVLFPMFVPSTLRKTVLTGLAAAMTGPVAALIFTRASGQGVPPFKVFLTAYIANFIVVGLVFRTAVLNQHLSLATTRARQMGSYELTELLGKGGMGEVWRASHRMLRRPAAIKLIRPEALGASGGQESATLVRRFEREAQATAELHSQHSIRLYDFGIAEDGAFFYVMELLDGLNMRTFVERFGPQPADRVVSLLLQACDSLWDAHMSGLIHRDIKPANLYVCRYGHEVDFVKVLDFGLVKHSDGADAQESGLTRAGVITGTPAFMAPEAARDGQVDVRSDIYSLGCVAYWLLTGQIVFEKDTPVQTVLAHCQDKPVPPSERTEIAIPSTLEAIIMSCLEKDPARRPQTASDLQQSLRDCGCATAWTQDEALEWWETHFPK